MWIHDIYSCLTIKSDTGQFVWCLETLWYMHEPHAMRYWVHWDWETLNGSAVSGESRTKPSVQSGRRPGDWTRPNRDLYQTLFLTMPILPMRQESRLVIRPFPCNISTFSAIKPSQRNYSHFEASFFKDSNGWYHWSVFQIEVTLRGHFKWINCREETSGFQTKCDTALVWPKRI